MTLATATRRQRPPDRAPPPTDGPLSGAPLGIDNASSANARSLADWNRSSGFFSRQRWTTRSSAGGIAGVAADSGGGSSLRMADSVSAALSRSNARRPEIISYITQPNE